MFSVYAVIVFSYFLFVMGISLFTKKLASRSSADFLIAGRNLGIVTCAVVVASEWLGGMSTIGVSEKAFTTGTLQPILYNFATSLGMIIIGFTVATHYRRKEVHTVSEMIEHLFDRRCRHISAVAFLIAYITLAYIQLQTCSSVISTLFGMSWIWGIFLSAIIITTYTYIGGLHALAITSVFHVIVMFGGIGIAVCTGLIKVGGLAALKGHLVVLGSPVNLYNPFSAGLSYAFSLLLGGILGGMAGQASIQPIFAAKNPSVAKRAAIASALIIAPFGVMIALLGLIAKTGIFFDVTTLTDVKMVLPRLLTTPSFIHPIFGGLALAGILAAILSTVGPVNFAVVTIVAKDIYAGLMHEGADDQQILRTSRNLVILINFIIIPLALIFHKKAIIDAAYVSYAIRAIGAIVIVLGIYGSRFINGLGVKLAFVGGTLTIFVCLIAGRIGLFTVDKTFGAVCAAIVFVAVGLLLGKKDHPPVSVARGTSIPSGVLRGH